MSSCCTLPRLQAMAKGPKMPVPGAGTTSVSERPGGVEIALDPSELEMDSAAMAARYEQTLREQQSHLAKEDLSDMVAEHAARQKVRGAVSDSAAFSNVCAVEPVRCVSGCYTWHLHAGNSALGVTCSVRVWIVPYTVPVCLFFCGSLKNQDGNIRWEHSPAHRSQPYCKID